MSHHLQRLCWSISVLGTSKCCLDLGLICRVCLSYAHGSSVGRLQVLPSCQRHLMRSVVNQALHGHTANTGWTGNLPGASCYPCPPVCVLARGGIACFRGGRASPSYCGCAWHAHSMRDLPHLRASVHPLLGAQVLSFVPLAQVLSPPLPAAFVLDPDSPSLLCWPNLD